MNNQLNESVLGTIKNPVLSGKGLEIFVKEMKSWKEAGFITKWQKNRLFSTINIYLKGIKKPYKISITGFLSKDLSYGANLRAKNKSRLVGKIKSPFKLFYSFKAWGFYEIMEKLFEIVEQDIQKGNPQKKMSEKEAEKWTEEFEETFAEVEARTEVFKQIDQGNVSYSFSIKDADNKGKKEMDIKESIQKNSGIIERKELFEMAQADIPKDYKGPEDFLKKYIANFEKRSGKDFTAAGVAGLKRTIKDLDMAEKEKVIELAEKQFPKSATSRGGSVSYSPEQISAAKKFIEAVGAENARKVLNAALK